MSLPRTPMAVVFDMDGLLCDTEVVYRDAMTAALAEQGYEVSAPLFQSMIGLPGPAGDQKMIDHFGPDFPLEGFNARVMVHVDAACEAGIALKAGVLELLDHLDELAVPRACDQLRRERGTRIRVGVVGEHVAGEHRVFVA